MFWGEFNKWIKLKLLIKLCFHINDGIYITLTVIGYVHESYYRRTKYSKSHCKGARFHFFLYTYNLFNLTINLFTLITQDRALSEYGAIWVKLDHILLTFKLIDIQRTNFVRYECHHHRYQQHHHHEFEHIVEMQDTRSHDSGSSGLSDYVNLSFVPESTVSWIQWTCLWTLW